MKKLLFTCLSIATILTSFTNCKNNTKNYQTDTETQVTYVEADDLDMNEAIAKAKASFGKFEKALIENSKNNKYENLMVKQGFKANDGGIEHMWIMDIEYKNNKLEGILSSIPIMDSSLQFGDTVVIDKNQISDWIFTDMATGDIHGGYTIQVLRKNMSAEEGKAFDQEWGTNFVDK